MSAAPTLAERGPISSEASLCVGRCCNAYSREAPRELDHALLVDASAALGIPTLDDAIPVHLRAEFWNFYDAASTDASAASVASPSAGKPAPSTSADSQAHALPATVQR